MELLPSTRNKIQRAKRWLLAEGTDAAITASAQHSPPTVFWLYQGTPSFSGSEILLANDGRLASLEGNICTNVIVSHVLLQMTRFRLRHKQHTDEEPVEYFYTLTKSKSPCTIQKSISHLKAAIFTLQHFKRTQQPGMSKEEQKKGPKTRVKEAKTEESRDWKCTRTDIFSEAMICSTKMYRQRVSFKVSYQSVTTGSSHWKTAVTLRSIND